MFNTENGAKLDPTTFKENQIFEDIHQAVKKSNEFTVSTNDGLVIRFSSLRRAIRGIL